MVALISIICILCGHHYYIWNASVHLFPGRWFQFRRVSVCGASQILRKTGSLKYSVVGHTWQDNCEKMYLTCLVSNALNKTFTLIEQLCFEKEFFFLMSNYQSLQTIPHLPGSHCNFHQKSNRIIYFGSNTFCLNKCDQKMISNNDVIHVLGLVKITQRWA